MWYEDEDGVFTSPKLQLIDQQERKDVQRYICQYGIDMFWLLADKGCFTDSEKFWAIALTKFS